MSRRTAGTGTIERTRGGKYRIRMTDHVGRRTSLGTVDSRQEAEILLEAAAGRLESATKLISSGISLAELGKRYLDQRDARGLTNERSRWRSHLESDPIAEMPVRAVTAYDIRCWIERVGRSAAKRGHLHKASRPRPVAKSTMANALNLLRGCLHYAVAEQVIDVNPAIGISVPRRREDLRAATVESWTWLDVDEQRYLLASCPKPLNWLVQFAIWTGLRESELWELRACDVRDDSPNPHVVVRFGSAGGPTKGRRIRYTPLLPGALEAWQEWRKDPVVGRKIAATGVAFPPLRGSTRSTRAPGPPPWWERVVAKAGVIGQTGAPVHFHSLRHTCASMLVSGSWGASLTLEEVKGFLGHRHLSTTERYAHLAPSALARAADRIRTAMSTPTAPIVDIPTRYAK